MSVDSQTFSDAYDIGTGIWNPDTKQEVRLGYSRAVILPMCRDHARKFMSVLRLTSNDSVLVVGAGFGWTGECLAQEVPGIAVVNTDNSPWVHSVKGDPETQDIEAAIAATGFEKADPRYAKALAQLDDGLPRSRMTIENEDSLTKASRTRLLSAGSYTHAVTEDVMPWLSDAEAVTLDAAMHLMGATVTHMITPLIDLTRQDPTSNWKSLIDWKRLLPNSNITGTNRNPEVL